MSDLTNNFMGVDFDYSNAIHKPSDSGSGPSMGTEGRDIVNNMKGMIDYGMLLVKQDNSNDSKRVQKTPGKLGNQYFINTNTQCTNGNNKYNKYIFISNRLSGDMSLSNFSGAPTGLIPGMISNIGRVDPVKFFDAVFNETTGECKLVKLKTFKQQPDGTTTEETEQQYMGVEDICELEKDHFADYDSSDDSSDQYTSSRAGHCDGFSNMKNNYDEEKFYNMPDDQMMQIYLTTLTLLGLYVTLKIIYKI
tara:strand:- start:10 stop:759 length:750 start_codon:yes stop_codon:yes gene_type:complete